MGAQQLFFNRRPKAIDVGKMAIEVLYRCNPDGFEVTQAREGEATTFTWFDRDNDASKAADVKALRKAFEEVSTPAEAAKFMERSGPFRSGASSVTWLKFREWQEYFRTQRLRVSGFGNQPEHSSRAVEFSERVVMPAIKVHARELDNGEVEITKFIDCESVVDTIAALNLLDRIRRADVKPCARLACRKLFEKEDPRKRYCTHACAVAANREDRKKRTNPKGKRKVVR